MIDSALFTDAHERTMSAWPAADEGADEVSDNVIASALISDFGDGRSLDTTGVHE